MKKAPIGSFQAFQVKRLTREILDEIFKALGLGDTGWQRKLLWPLFWFPAYRFARLTVDFDEIVGRSGFGEAAQWLLARFTQGYRSRGADNIPPSGPLIIASNHPGTFDALVIMAHIPRKDVKLIVSGVPFLRGLGALKDYFIYATADPYARMNTLRSALRHLQSGGALLLFASGLVDPDPAFLPGAYEALNLWSGSLEVFIRKVPETRLVISIVSGVLAPQCMQNPLVRKSKMGSWQRQRIAEYVQVMQQLVFGSKFGLHPQVSFGRSLPALELAREPGGAHTRETILSLAREELSSHITWRNS